MIEGTKEVINRARSLPVGHPAGLVSWDLLERIPDLYKAHVVAVPFKAPTKLDAGDFEPVGSGAYMPAVDLMNRISEARGINGLDKSTIEPIIQEIDWNRMICNFTEAPKLVKYLVGYTVTKMGSVLGEDGEMRISDPCSVSYNAWERVCELFGKEEAATNYYDPSIVKRHQDGTGYFEKTWKGEVSKSYLKYETRAKRQSAFDSEIKFAQRKADTKARNVVTRVLCGMLTGYNAEQLKEGAFYVGRITRSEFAIKSEHAARLQAMANGNSTGASKALFAPPPEPEQEQEPEIGRNVTPLSGQEQLMKKLSYYVEKDLVVESMKDSVERMAAWLESEPNAENCDLWATAQATMNQIEQQIPQELLYQL